MIQKLQAYVQVIIIVVICIIIFYPLLIVVNYGIFYRNKIYPKIKIAYLDFSGKNPVSDIPLLENKITYLKFSELTLESPNKEWLLNLNDIDFNYLPQISLKKAFALGREGNLQQNWLTKWQLWHKGVNLDLDYQYREDLLKEKIATIAAFLYIPNIPPTININKEAKITVRPGQTGQQLDEEKLMSLINNRLAKLNSEKITIPLNLLSSLITDEQINQTVQKAEKLLTKKIKLEFKDNMWELTDKELINFLSFNGDFNEEKIASYTAQLATFIDKPPQNALFNFSAGRVGEFKPAQDGFTLNQNQTNQLLLQAMEGLLQDNNSLASITLPVNISKPQIAIEDINNLGIKELIGKGESYFKGSITARIHNIKLASQRINGLLVAPGQTFSFNNTLGDVSAQTGFQQAYVIKEGRTVLGDGGGVCQVSTTLFRAILNAGLPIEERQAHAYRVGYYEQNSFVGLDATVFAPSPDLKFLNDTLDHILIQTEIDIPNYKLTFYLYGTGDGREASISASRIWDQVPPPPDLYQDDPTLPPGIVKQVDWKAWGAKVAFDWKVVRGNDILQNRTFYSNYRPWQAVFLRGPIN